MRTLRAGRAIRYSKGYTYLVVIVAVMIMGIFAQVVTVSSQHLKRQDREAELIFRGMAYVRAIESYYLAKKDKPMFPRDLEDLESDGRFLYKRHIRKLYIDPITNSDWQIIRSVDGGIAGVASSSSLEPLKKNNFPLELNALTGSEKYSEWFFEYKVIKKNNK